MAVIDGEWLSKEGLTYFWSKIKSIFTKQTETNVIANLGAKNIADFNFGGVVSDTDVKPGTIVCTETNGTFSFSGASSDKNYAAYVLKQFLVKAGTYKISGVSGGSNTTYWMRVGTGTTDAGLFNLYDAELEFTLASDKLITVRVVIYANQTVSNLVFKPMIRPVEITDNTFEPYAPTNRELYEIKTEQTETNVIANLGAKNMLKVSSTTQTIGGVTFTVNDDQTIKVNGTNSLTSTALFTIEDIPLPAGIAYTLSGCPSGGSNATYYIGSLDTTNWATFATDTGNGGTATLSEPKTIRFRIGIRSGVTVNNLLFKPMLRRAEITDDTFEPYAPSNRELYETRFASKEILRDNVDLNNIKTGGIYNGVNSTGNSAVHMPVATGSFNFVLTVIEANEFIIQIFKQLNSAGDPNFYVRRFYIYNSDWDSWYQFTGTQV